MIDAFLDHMRACDIAPADPDEIIADDKRRRYRLEGDKPRVRNGSYQLKVEPDGFAVGWAMSFRDGTAHAWHSKSDRKVSAEDRAAWKKRTADAKLLRDAQALTGAKAAADKAKRIWARASETGTTGYLNRKACGLHGARVWQGLVVVPMYGAAGLVGLQFIAADGAKRFLTDCAKEGAYFPITTKDEGKSTIIICEGFATGAAIRQATGYPVVVAFDAGNLKPVALAMRRKYPDARIVIGADNDQWTKSNPGQAKAQQAALAIGGAQVVSPLIPDDDDARRTDWDDVARSDGLDAVRQAFEAAPDIALDYDDSPRDYADPVARDDPFRCLGHSRGLYYFLPRSNGGQVVALTASSLGTMMGLLQLHSSYDFWQSGFGDGKANDKKVATMAGAALIDMCNRAGVFRPETVRGAGAWRDTVGIVVNDGHAVITKDARVPLYEWRGKAIYEADQSIYAANADPLDSAGAVVVRGGGRRCSNERARPPRRLPRAEPVHDLGVQVRSDRGGCKATPTLLAGTGDATRAGHLGSVLEPEFQRPKCFPKQYLSLHTQDTSHSAF